MKSKLNSKQADGQNKYHHEKYRIENYQKKSTKPNAGSSQNINKVYKLIKIDKEGKKKDS